MSVIEMKQRLGEIIETLPESNLKVVLDFAMYLKEKRKKAMIKKTSRSIAESTFGMWHDEVDGIEYMDKMRAQWVQYATDKSCILQRRRWNGPCA